MRAAPLGGRRALAAGPRATVARLARELAARLGAVALQRVGRRRGALHPPGGGAARRIVTRADYFSRRCWQERGCGWLAQMAATSAPSERAVAARAAGGGAAARLSMAVAVVAVGLVVLLVVRAVVARRAEADASEADVPNRLQGERVGPYPDIQRLLLGGGADLDTERHRRWDHPD